MGAGTFNVMLDRDYEIRYDYNAMADLDFAFLREAGKSFVELWAADLKEDEMPPEIIGYGGTRLLLWAGLRWSHPKLTLDMVGVLMQKGVKAGTPYTDFLGQCLQAMQASGVFGNKEDKEEADATEGKGEEEKKVNAGATT